MPKSTAHRNELLNLIYRAVAIADFADNDATSPSTNIYVALHTADPGDAGAQNASEVAYTNYARVPVVRGAGWNAASGGALDNAGEIAFPQCGVTGDTAFFWSTGKGSSGATDILHRGPIGSVLGACVGENSNNQITLKTHGRSVDDRVAFFTAPGTALPAGITGGVVYFVLAVVDADNFTISTTSGGSAVDITADGAALALLVTPRVISDGVTPRFAAGTLDVVEG